VSRDIHDSLGQLLTGLRMEISSLQSKLERPPLNRSEIVALVGRADQLIERIQKSIRDLVSFLQPRVVIEKGLAAAIQSIIWENERYGDIQYETAVDLAEDALDQDQAIAVYRIVQECLTNVVRHAKASRVRIRCVSERESLLVQIEDNGVGYDATAESSGEGWGLFGIRTRVKLLSGTISIKSALGQGTRVFVEIPLVKGRDV
jgi:signal transduction histidine kinase